MGQNPGSLVNIKIAGKWMVIPVKMVLIGIDPTPVDVKACTRYLVGELPVKKELTSCSLEVPSALSAPFFIGSSPMSSPQTSAADIQRSHCPPKIPNLVEEVLSRISLIGLWSATHCYAIHVWTREKVPSGKLTFNYGKSPFFLWENPLFQLGNFQ